MKRLFLFAAWAAALFLTRGLAQADDQKFEISKFDVRGNSLLSKEEVANAVAPFTGKERVYGDVQKALEALEAAYHVKGYGAVNVFVPEQELKGGVVILQVTEAAIGNVTVTGNQFYSEENVRASLPLLKEGTTPNLVAISDNVQLANENPGKRVEMTLGVSPEDGKINAKVSVADENPKRVYMSVDNTGEKDKTGQYRFGVSYRDANVFGRDEVLTLGYIMAPDAPSGVDVNVYTVGLRMPFYKLGDSLDLIIAASDVNIPANVITPGGTLALAGKGNIYAARWNHLYQRQGEYRSRLVLGADYKWTANPCKPVLISASCIDYLETPVSATYIGQWQKPNLAADFSFGVAYNPTLFDHQQGWRYNYASNGRDTESNFLILKGGGTYLRSLPGDWQVRGAIAAQYSANPLPTGEQMGLAGSTAVRGFGERALTADSGYVINVEGYSPDLAGILGAQFKREFPGTLRALVFYDLAYGENTPNDGNAWVDGLGNSNPAGLKSINEITTISSVGIGLRYSLRKDISAKFDWARVLDSSPANRANPANIVDDLWRVHFSVIYGF